MGGIRLVGIDRRSWPLLGAVLGRASRGLQLCGGRGVPGVEYRQALGSHHRGHGARLHRGLSRPPALPSRCWRSWRPSALVATKWCIDEARVYLIGQSDGGMAADTIAFLAKTRGTADAIASSAAGVSGQDLAEYSCPEPLPVMVIAQPERYGLSRLRGRGRGRALRSATAGMRL